jgi:FAD:protein FMN transferase
MICFSSSGPEDARPLRRAIERVRPLLGTFVSIRLENLPAAEAHRAIGRGFAAIAEIHALMSFHEPASDIARLNREAYTAPVAVHPHSFAVLRRAIEIAQASNGVFDIAVAGALVAQGVLPRPASAQEPDPAACWRDIELLQDDRVRFARPLWLDLGGIAKGYAVDRAMISMALGPKVQSCVNAGGDLRVSGPLPEAVRLRMTMPGAAPVVEILNGSLASSTGVARWGAARAAHLNGASRRVVGARRFVSVAAQSCMTADALTKVVLAKGPRAEGLLRRCGAVAYLYSARAGWRILGRS